MEETGWEFGQRKTRHMGVFITIAFLIFLAISSEAKIYAGYKLYNITTPKRSNVSYFSELEDRLELDFWNDQTVMVAPKYQNEFLSAAREGKIRLKIVNDNLDKTVNLERQQVLATGRPSEGEIDFKNFHRYDTIVSYLKRLSKQYPKIATLETIGKSYEGRKLYALKVSSGGSATKPVIFVDAGMHAREWISPAVALYIIKQLVENEENASLYAEIDWHVVAMINPDGYEYSHTKDRFWRKTRSKRRRSEKAKCCGTDPNRNFGFKWGLAGSGTNECSPTYRGKEPFSEPETRAIRDLALKHQENIKLYLTLHSYGQELLHAWGYTDKVIDDMDEVVRVAGAALEAIKEVNGNKYWIGSSATKGRSISGSSRDYFFGKLKVKYSCTIELPGGRNSGFILPPRRIARVVSETFEGIKAFWEEIIDIYT